jgi:hypothetical protein
MIFELPYVLNKNILQFLGLRSAGFLIESGFKSRVGYNSSGTVYKCFGSIVDYLRLFSFSSSSLTLNCSLLFIFSKFIKSSTYLKFQHLSLFKSLL